LDSLCLLPPLLKLSNNGHEEEAPHQPLATLVYQTQKSGLSTP
jgi:hypothetical protein